MYKIFVNDKPIIFSLQPVVSGLYKHLPHTVYSQQTLMDRVRAVEEQHNNGEVIVCQNIDEAWVEFNTYFKAIHAAGGIVFNTHNKLLIIKRLGKWDLPKGKIDAGETIEEAAIREVEEECGIDNLSITKKITVSYHTYKLYGHRFLKVTHWFEMNTFFTGTLIPQAEENITEAIWVNKQDIKPIELDTYASIRDILLMIGN